MWRAGREENTGSDSSSLMLRLQIPRMLYFPEAIQMSPKEDDDLMMGMKEGRISQESGLGRLSAIRSMQNIQKAGAGRFFKTKINWNRFLEHFQDTAPEDLLTGVQQLLLQTEAGIPDAEIKKYLDPTSRTTLCNQPSSGLWERRNINCAKPVIIVCMLIRRRAFLQMSSLATSSLLLPKFLKAFEGTAHATAGNKVLVILQLSGGNDGLNTVIPVRNDIYYRERPRLGIQKDKTLALTEEAGLHPALTYFKALYDEGIWPF